MSKAYPEFISDEEWKLAGKPDLVCPCGHLVTSNDNFEDSDGDVKCGNENCTEECRKDQNEGKYVEIC